MQTLAASFIGVGVVIFAALAAGVGAGTARGLVPQNVREPRFVAAVGVAGLLHLPLPVSRNHHRKEPRRCYVRDGCVDGLRLRYSHDWRLGNATLRRQAGIG